MSHVICSWLLSLKEKKYVIYSNKADSLIYRIKLVLFFEILLL